MIGMFQVVVFYSVFGSAFGLSENTGLFEQHKGNQLANSVFHSLFVDTAMDCAMECTNKKICKSLNYQYSNNDVKQCHLNNRTKGSAPAADFKRDPGFTYYEKDPCVPSPCLFASACSKDNNDDGFRCHCMPGYKGCLCQTELFGWFPRNPAKSCKDILTTGDAVHDGNYWIDPGNSGSAIQVYCDMGKDQGGWLLISNVVIPTSGSVPSLTTLSSSYRDIANYNNNVTILSASALGQLHQLINFTQLRFHCRKSAVGRTINLITLSASIDVVNYFVAVSNVRPAACNSFQRGTGDNSKLADVCSQWGYSGKWGSDSRINEWRIHDHAFFVPTKYHWVNKNQGLACDSRNTAISPGDYWKIYVR